MIASVGPCIKSLLRAVCVKFLLANTGSFYFGINEPEKRFINYPDGCIDQMDIIAMHIYNSDSQAVISLITQLFNTWKKPIWITEISPTTEGCSFDSTGMTSYLNTVIPLILKLGYVEKIFWNCGEPSSTPVTCNPSLTNMDGSATAVLQALGAACGITPGGTASS